MIAKYSKGYRINMANYEHLEFSLDVMINNTEDFPDLDDEELIAKAKELVEEGLRDDIVAAHNDTDKEESFIHLHPFNQ